MLYTIYMQGYFLYNSIDAALNGDVCTLCILSGHGSAFIGTELLDTRVRLSLCSDVHDLVNDKDCC